jgi:hypothetical protein
MGGEAGRLRAMGRGNHGDRFRGGTKSGNQAAGILFFMAVVVARRPKKPPGLLSLPNYFIPSLGMNHIHAVDQKN